MRRAFSMIMAVIFIIVLALVGLLTLNVSSTGVSQTTGQYLREQAELLAISATEAAIFGIQENTSNGDMETAAKKMVKNIQNIESIYTIDVDVKCIGTGKETDGTSNVEAGKCTGFEKTEKYGTDGVAITNKLQAVIITAIVSTDLGGEQVRIVKTTTQKP